MADDKFEFPIESDPDILLADWLEEVRQHFPNFNPAPNSLAYRSAAALASMIAVGMDVAAVVPNAIFRTVGQSLYGIQPLDPLPAVADTTWTAIDGTGHETIPAGTVLTVSGVLFETTEDILWPSGTTVVTPVGISAVDEGADANDLGVPGDPISLEEDYEFISSVVLVNKTLAGQDGETIADFMVRLRRTLRVYYPHAVRGSDLELIARTLPGVYRALSIDNYDFPTSTPNVEGVATVFLQGFDGLAVPGPIKDDYESLILPDDRRLVNNVLYVEDPTFTPVNVNFSFTVHTGSEPAVVGVAAEAAVADLFDPIKWGLPSSGEEPLWTNKTVVSVYDVAGALDRVEGLDRVTVITIGLNADTPTAGDKTLSGVGVLTTPGTINGTAV